VTLLDGDFGMMFFALVRHLTPDRAARFDAALLGLGEIALAAMAAMLAVSVACLDRDFGVMFLALVRRLAPDGASGFPDFLLLLREIAAMAPTHHTGEVALGFLLHTALFSIRHDQNSDWSRLSPVIL
jgi:hypothetical protein